MDFSHCGEIKSNHRCMVSGAGRGSNLQLIFWQ